MNEEQLNISMRNKTEPGHRETDRDGNKMLINPVFQNQLMTIDPLPEKLSVGTGTIRHHVRQKLGYISAVSISPDGLRVAASSDNLTAIYDWQNEVEVLRHASNGRVTSFGFYPDGKHIVIGTEKKGLTFYDIDNQSVTTTLNFPSSVQRIKINEINGLMAVALDNTVTVLCSKTGEKKRGFSFESLVHDVSIIQEFPCFCVQTETAMEVWDYQKNKRIKTFPLPTKVKIYNEMSVDGIIIEKITIGQHALIWDVANEIVLRHFPHPYNIIQAELDTTNGYLYTSSRDGIIRMFDINGNELVQSWNIPDIGTYLCFDQNSKWLISGNDKLRIYDLTSYQKVKELNDFSSPVINVCLNKEQNRLLVAGYHGTLKMFDLETGLIVRRFSAHSSWISDVTIDESKGVIATSSHDGTGQVYDMSGRLLLALHGHEDCVHCVAIHPDKNIMATGERANRIILWDLNTGEMSRSWHAHDGYVRSVIFDPTGQYLLSAGNDGLAKCWSFNNFQCVVEYGFHMGDVYFANFSPDNAQVVTASNDKTFKLYTFQGELIKIFEGHRAGVREVVFLNDGTLISASLDGTARRWDQETGQCLQVYTAGHIDWLRCVKIRNQDEAVLIIGSRDGTISFSEVKSGQNFATLHNLDHGFLWTTPDEWFWTDRPELLDVIEAFSDGRFNVLHPDSAQYQDYMATHNSMTQVMSRIKNKNSYNEQLEKLVSIHKEINEQKTVLKLMQVPGT